MGLVTSGLKLFLVLVAFLVGQVWAVAQVKPQQRWGIVVGAQDYQHYPRLKFARSDAKKFRDYLVNNLQFNPASTKLFVDGPVVDSRPTAGNVLGALEDILASPDINPTDIFVFYFAGHGISTPTADYLLPTDARDSTAARLGISVADIAERLVSSKLRNVWLVIDACRDGSENGFGQLTAKVAKDGNLALCMSCQPGAVSYELPSLNGGVFTTAVLETLSRQAASSTPMWITEVQSSLPGQMLQTLAMAKASVKQIPYTFLSSERDILLKLPSLSAQPLPAFMADLKKKALTPSSFTTSLLSYSASAQLFSDPYVYEAAKTAHHLDPSNEDARYLLASASLAIGNVPLALELVYSPKVAYQSSGMLYLQLALSPYHFRKPSEIVDFILRTVPPDRPEAPWLRASSVLVATPYLVRFGASSEQILQYIARYDGPSKGLATAREISLLYASEARKERGSLVTEATYPRLLKLLSNLYRLDPTSGERVYHFFLSQMPAGPTYDRLLEALPASLAASRAVKISSFRHAILSWKARKITDFSSVELTELEEQWRSLLGQGLTNSEVLSLLTSTGFPVLGLMLDDQKPLNVGSRFVDEGLGALTSTIKYLVEHPDFSYADSFRPLQSYLPQAATLFEQTNETEQAFLILTLQHVMFDAIDAKLAADCMDRAKEGKGTLDLFAKWRRPEVLIGLPGLATALSYAGATTVFWDDFQRVADLAGEGDIAIEYRLRLGGGSGFTSQYLAAFAKQYIRGMVSEAVYVNWKRELPQFASAFDQDLVLQLFGSAKGLSAVEVIQSFTQSLIGTDYGTKLAPIRDSKKMLDVVTAFRDRHGQRILYDEANLLCVALTDAIVGTAVREGNSKMLEFARSSEAAQHAHMSHNWLPWILGGYEAAKALKDWPAQAEAAAKLFISGSSLGCGWIRGVLLREMCAGAITNDNRAIGLFVWRELEKTVRSSVTQDLSFVPSGAEHFSMSRVGTGWVQAPNESRLIVTGNWNVVASKDGGVVGTFDGKGCRITLSGRVSDHGLVDAQCEVERERKKETGHAFFRLPGADDKLPKWLQGMPMNGYIILDGGGLGFFHIAAS